MSLFSHESDNDFVVRNGDLTCGLRLVCKAARKDGDNERCVEDTGKIWEWVKVFVVLHVSLQFKSGFDLRSVLNHTPKMITVGIRTSAPSAIMGPTYSTQTVFNARIRDAYFGCIPLVSDDRIIRKILKNPIAKKHILK